MEHIKVLDENGNIVLLRPIIIKGEYLINRLQLNSESINFKEVAKDVIVREMLKEMYKHLFFTETNMPDGSVMIEARTYFYGL